MSLRWASKIHDALSRSMHVGKGRSDVLAKTRMISLAQSHPCTHQRMVCTARQPAFRKARDDGLGMKPMSLLEAC
jgi:hypothetical protein